MTARYGEAGGGSTLAVLLRYDGSMLLSGLLEHTLHDQIEQAKANLRRLVSEGAVPGGGPMH